MSYDLPPGSFGTAAPLFRSAGFDRALPDAVFEGRQAGRIFVDDLQSPRAAFLCRTYDCRVAADPGAAAPRRFMSEARAEAGVSRGCMGTSP